VVLSNTLITSVPVGGNLDLRLPIIDGKRVSFGRE
jgi:hypothetical protein